ncbi:MAG: DUF4326 domain-containing protein [Cyanobium sp.]
MEHSSPLGNPYAFGRDGNREEVIAQYRRWLRVQLPSPGSLRERLLRATAGPGLILRAEAAVLASACPWPRKGWTMDQVLAPIRAWRLRAVPRMEMQPIGSIFPAPSRVCRKSVRPPSS